MSFLNNVLCYGVSPGGEFQMMRTSVFKKAGGYDRKLVRGRR